MVLITGAGRGLGRELARQYAQDGWRVIACGRTPPAQRFERSIEFQPLDVADPTSIFDLATRLAGRPLDVLVNNAAIRSEISGLHDFAPDEFLKVMRTNTLGPLLLARALRPNLVAGRMRIIANIGSRAGSMAEGLLDDYDNDYAYRCSKAALNMVGAQLAQDLLADRITVLSLHPGWVKTDMGGDQAVLAVEDSARGLRRVIDDATPRDSGSFRTFDGVHIGW
ncbi:SDR family oxidoreductase [Mesorhizobium sp. M7D.F.Ca.US.005.01.1.1]|uniref:SDR family oxidoreductase n=1 Tax=Mesorhizobium sp. M7D.F.Ca.US.005.01.1.1 TaxID=2493678 RepID=UPI000F758E3E|nr:SDR family oxidoreductase [Mesorhizobium sp. M7D.F.Ca.US.005.01.1.1]AZO45693.1 SDR family oxidoreductase [Mesorhizobium sp. M7D.F.Ca.US.005.01.1.1]